MFLEATKGKIKCQLNVLHCCLVDLLQRKITPLLTIAIYLGIVAVATACIAKPAAIPDNMIKIYTWKDLQAIQNNLDGDYIIMNDIVFPEPGTEDFPKWGFVPLGYDYGTTEDDVHAFKGTLDGNGKKISNFYLNANYADYQKPNAIVPGKTLAGKEIGLFAAIYRTNPGDAVKNLILRLRPTDATYTTSVAGPHTVGALVGLLVTGSITNVGVEGGLVSGNDYIAGLVSTLDLSSSIIGYSTANVSSTHSSAGGLVAYISQGSTAIGYATGKVLAGEASGGVLVGWNDGGTAIGYSKGEASAIGAGGGLVGTTSRGGNSVGYSRSKVIRLSWKTNPYRKWADKNFGKLGSIDDTASLNGYSSAESAIVDYNTNSFTGGKTGQDGKAIKMDSTITKNSFSELHFIDDPVPGPFIWLGNGKWPAIDIGSISPPELQNIP